MTWHVLIAGGLRGWTHTDTPQQAAARVVSEWPRFPGSAAVLVLDKRGVVAYEATVADCRGAK